MTPVFDCGFFEETLMETEEKGHSQAADEATRLRRRVAELEASEAELRRTEAALKKECDFSSAVLNAVDALVAVLDRHGAIVSFNRACELATGYSFGEVRGKKVWDVLLTPEEVEPVKRVFADLKAGMFPNRFENCWIAKDGRRLFVSWSNAILLDAVGEVEYVVPTGIDISERRRAEEDRQSLQSQLLQSQKLESVGRLAGGIAHDFNNLLSAIIGYSEMVMAELPAGDSLRQSVRIIKEAGERAATLTRQLLAFSRNQVLEMKPVNLNAVAEDMGNMLIRMIGEDVLLEIRNKTPVSNVLADRGQIEQILLNLALNARDAMPRGGRLEIRTSEVELSEEDARSHAGLQQGRYVTLSVTDSGMGMTGEVKQRIFEPFFTTKGPGQHSGLGLSTVYGIIQQHNGGIEVTSEPGAGSTFRIYLPAAQGETMEEREAQEPVFMPHGTETILMVDDEAAIRKLVVDMLEPLGYRLLTASGGEEAIKVSAAFDGPIDLLVTDVIMPGMNGSELAAALKKQRPFMPVIFMSGYTDSGITGSGMLDDESEYIQKPISRVQLAARIREVLDKKPEEGK
jgi:two-component system cell cycle sensor histidine kinase/response regulator CckA